VTLFEYLAIAFGLFYSVAALRILGGLPSAFREERRYWVHLTISFFTLMAIASSFWTFWSLREATWTYPGFLLALLLPGMLFYCAAILVPENPEDVDSWRDYYYATHRRLFVGYGIWGLAAAASATVNLGMPLLHPARVIHAIMPVVAAIGAGSSRHRVHAGLAIAMGLMVVIWGVTAGLRPDALLAH